MSNVPANHLAVPQWALKKPEPLNVKSDAMQPEGFILASLDMIQSHQEFNLADFCSQTCGAENNVGSSFFKSWPRWPLGPRVAGLLSGPEGDVRGQYNC